MYAYMWMKTNLDHFNVQLNQVQQYANEIDLRVVHFVCVWMEFWRWISAVVC